jgi:hypothetical protein
MRGAGVREWLRRGTGAAAGRAVAGALVLAALAGAVWLGLRWTDTAETTGRGGASLAATASAAPTGATGTGRAAVGNAPAANAPTGTGLADRQEAPGTPAAWQLLVEELYGRRARCFGAGTPELLGGVYAPGSPLRAADEAHVRALAAAGETLRGFAPAVVEVTGVSVTGERALLDLVDRRPEYEVVTAGSAEGPALRTEPGRPGTAVRMALLRTPEGWRIESAERVG